MASIVNWILVVALIISVQVIICDGRERVIYGNDDRSEVYRITDANDILLREATVLLVSKSKLTTTNNGQTYSLSSSRMTSLCDGELFKGQLVGGHCSGFLVADDTVVTAGHCLNSLAECSDTAFVFNFQEVSNTTETQVTNIAGNRVYFCSEILGSNNYNLYDYSVVKLDRGTGRTPISVDMNSDQAVGTAVALIGHPSGLPMKISPNAEIKTAQDKRYFTANIDAFAGNSGSMVTDVSSGSYQVAGILVRGNTDFITVTRDGVQCKVVMTCTDSGGCSGSYESVSKTMIFEMFVPGYKGLVHSFIGPQFKTIYPDLTASKSILFTVTNTNSESATAVLTVGSSGVEFEGHASAIVSDIAISSGQTLVFTIKKTVAATNWPASPMEVTISDKTATRSGSSSYTERKVWLSAKSVDGYVCEVGSMELDMSNISGTKGEYSCVSSIYRRTQTLGLKIKTSGKLSINTCGSASTDTIISISKVVNGEAVEVQCVDDFSTSTYCSNRFMAALIDFPVQAGETYIISTGNWYLDHSTNITLAVSTSNGASIDNTIGDCSPTPSTTPTTTVVPTATNTSSPVPTATSTNFSTTANSTDSVNTTNLTNVNSSTSTTPTPSPTTTLNNVVRTSSTVATVPSTIAKPDPKENSVVISVVAMDPTTFKLFHEAQFKRAVAASFNAFVSARANQITVDDILIIDTTQTPTGNLDIYFIVLLNGTPVVKEQAAAITESERSTIEQTSSLSISSISAYVVPTSNSNTGDKTVPMVSILFLSQLFLPIFLFV
eukprot:Nk52_evm93s1737 gene=Nk52_evmTU93s1737